MDEPYSYYMIPDDAREKIKKEIFDKLPKERQEKILELAKEFEKILAELTEESRKNQVTRETLKRRLLDTERTELDVIMGRLVKNLDNDDLVRFILTFDNKALERALSIEIVLSEEEKRQLEREYEHYLETYKEEKGLD